MKLSFRLRKLLNSEGAQDVAKQLYNAKDRRGRLDVSLSETEEALAEYVGDYHRKGLDPPSLLPDYIFQSDTKLIEELENLGLIKVLYVGADEEGGSIASVETLNTLAITELYEQLSAAKYFIHYGIFSLNTVTGDAYCGDNKTRFHPSRGLFPVFRGFLDDPTRHKLSYQEIISRREGKPLEEINKSYTTSSDLEALTIEANQTIKDIKKRLSMSGRNNKFSKLFRTADKEYILFPGVNRQS